MVKYIDKTQYSEQNNIIMKEKYELLNNIMEYYPFIEKDRDTIFKKFIIKPIIIK